MNRELSTADSRSVWKERNQLPAVPRMQVLLACAVCFLCALGLPFCLWKGLTDTAAAWVSIGALIVLAAYVLRVSRHVAVIVAMLLGTAFFFAMTGGAVIGAVVLLLTVGVATGAFLHTVTGRPYLTLACTAAAFVAMAIVSRVPLFATLAFAFLPASILVAVCTLCGGERTSIVCAAAGGLLLSLLAFAAVWIYGEAGSLHPNTVMAYMESLREALVGILQQVRDEMVAIAAEQSAATAESFASLYTDELLRTTVASLFNVIPAIAIMLCSVLGFLGHTLLLALHDTAGLHAVNTVDTVRLRISLPAAIIYVVSFVLMLLLPETGVAYAVVNNLTLILLPGLILLAVRNLLFARREGAGRLMAPLLLMLALCCCSFGTPYLLALFGVSCAYRDFMHRMLIDKLRMGMSDGSGNENENNEK